MATAVGYFAQVRYRLLLSLAIAADRSRLASSPVPEGASVVVVVVERFAGFEESVVVVVVVVGSAVVVGCCCCAVAAYRAC